MTTNREIGYLWLFKDKANFGERPTDEAFEGYMKALLICANGDGTLAPEERDWAVGHAAALGASDALVDELKTYKAVDDIEQIITATHESSDSRRYIIYDAVRVCSADGAYSDRERAMVIRMGAKLGISEELVRQIEDICLEEARLREKRLKLLYPEGPPL
ncbi:TerB family tellurite resistance protein [Chondromyces apiculatus]|uniref:Uncharacterized protein n=1 Tax=Chondromyces apiculatus DSM 436 TaxID=1192034 RepID=A0A017T7C9_9BACT|nr:TerB family tellurite resistance protein [Chondromyces apiculatus]EYF05158.1 Hypothetical protein CAP_3523 [Chondromyces apiculatus DSM 436]